MSISINARNDYSFLFSSMNKASGQNAMSDMNWLSDYAAIKSGSYGKLMRAYYSSATEESGSSKDSASVLEKLTSNKNNVSTVSDETKAYNKAATAADALSGSISKLGELKSDATDDEIYNALNDYVKNYNSVVDTAGSTADVSISNRLSSIKTATASNEKALNGLGISIAQDGKLSINKDTFDAADKTKVSELFADKRSYAANVNVSASMIRSTANYDSAKAGTYTATGSYSSVVGSLWDSTT